MHVRLHSTSGILEIIRKFWYTLSINSNCGLGNIYMVNYKVILFGIIKKLFVFVLVLSILSHLSVAVLPAVDKTSRIYADASAPQGGNGSSEKPFGSIEEVLSELNYNLAFGNYSGNVEVIFAGGEYCFASTVRMSAAHSGRDNVRITYKAADGESVVFSGVSDGKVLNGSIIEVNGASYVTFEGISFRDNLNAPLLAVKGNNVSVVNCKFSDTGYTVSTVSPEKGYALSLDGNNNTVTGCEIYNGAGGVYMGGGSLTKLSVSGNAVRENTIHHVTGCAVYAGGVGADIANNTVTDAKRGIELAGALHKINHNCITEVTESAVRTEGSPVNAGIEVGYNFIDGAGEAAVSLPMGTSFSSVHHNIIRNGGMGIYLGGGRELTVENNILLFDSAENTSPHAIKYDMSFAEAVKADADLYGSVRSSIMSVYASDAWQKYFPQMKNIRFPESFSETDDTEVFYNPAESTVRNNAFYTAGDVRSAALTVTGKSSGHDVYQKRHGIIYGNVMMPRGSMTDFPLSDFGVYSLKSNASVFTLIPGFEDIPLADIGQESMVSTFPFVDVNDSDWYYKWAYYAQANGLMKGTDAAGTLFSPNATATRAMLVQILYNMEGAPEVEYAEKFTDVAEDAWYAPAVIWASDAGITSGTSADTFSPDKALTREQLAVFLYRYLRDYKKVSPAAGTSPDSFTDAGEVSSYTDFREAISWALGEGILTGKSSPYGLRLAPADTAVRSEAAAMLARFCMGME